jgi:uncharacterized protein (TIGR02145 family)
MLMLMHALWMVAQEVTEPPKKTREGTFTDSRDNQSYKWVKIGSQVWMAQNLNFNACYGCWCYDELADNCLKYGRLYSWEVALKACPKGWHIPSDREWDELKLFIKKEYPLTVGTTLKTTSGWDFNGNGTDKFGFAALPCGYRNNDEAFNLGGNSCFWWSGSEKDPNYAWARHLKFNYPFLNRFRGNKNFGFAIRCIKD